VDFLDMKSIVKGITKSIITSIMKDMQKDKVNNVLTKGGKKELLRCHPPYKGRYGELLSDTSFTKGGMGDCFQTPPL